MQPFRDFKSWYHNRHQAYRDVLTYDAERNRYIMNRSTITQNEVRPVDLAITGDKYHVFYTDMPAPPHEETRIECRDGE